MFIPSDCLSLDSTAALAKLLVGSGSLEDFTLLAESEDPNFERLTDTQTFEETAVGKFKDDIFVLLDMYEDPSGNWTQEVSSAALDRLIDMCKDSHSLTLLFFALPTILAYPDSFDDHPLKKNEDDAHPNAGHKLVVEAMIELCKNDLKKLWTLYKRFNNERTGYYQRLVADRINEISGSVPD